MQSADVSFLYRDKVVSNTFQIFAEQDVFLVLYFCVKIGFVHTLMPFFNMYGPLEFWWLRAPVVQCGQQWYKLFLDNLPFAYVVEFGVPQILLVLKIPSPAVLIKVEDC